MSYRDELTGDAVAAHDLARDLPDAMWASVVGRLVALSPPGGRCIDVGIGTGAVGGRLHDAGLDVVGVDANATMLDTLRRSWPGLPVAIGDARALPVAGGAADVVVLACVLHLVADWQGALAEAVRAARPGTGVVAVNVGTFARAGRTAVSRVFLDAVAARVELGPPTGPASSAELVDELVRLGCTALEPIVARGHAMRSIRDHIFRLQWNPFGWPAGTPQWTLTEAAEVATAWAIERFAGGIDTPGETPVAFGFSVCRVP